MHGHGCALGLAAARTAQADQPTNQRDCLAGDGLPSFRKLDLPQYGRSEPECSSLTRCVVKGVSGDRLFSQ
eukprot:5880087-Alexandrium_andersonii.AAC.1